jgi:hypothetical protein
MLMVDGTITVLSIYTILNIKRVKSCRFCLNFSLNTMSQMPYHLEKRTLYYGLSFKGLIKSGLFICLFLSGRSW